MIPLRCFTFQDFQSVPTIEEFAQILDIPVEKRVPYQHAEQPTSMSTLSQIMKMSVKELDGRFTTLNDMKGVEH